LVSGNGAKTNQKRHQFKGRGWMPKLACLLPFPSVLLSALGGFMRICALTLILCVLLLSTIAGVAQGLRAGAAKTVITPDLRGHAVYLAGFGHNRIATGVHDDLYVRCLALADESTTLTLCSADLIGLFYEDVQKIRKIFTAEAPAHSWLIVACTHVHEGPDTLGLWGASPTQGGVDGDYLDWVEHRIAATAIQAVHRLQPARLEFGRDDHPLLQQLQSVDRPPYVHDPFLFALRVTNVSTGVPIATVVNWSDHPETLGRANTQISADYPHWLCDYLEGRLGGTALFLNGTVGKVSALGGDVALQDPETGGVAADGTWRKAELLGTLLGRLTERSLKSSERSAIDRISIAHSTAFVALQNDRFRMAIAAGVFGNRRPLYTAGKLDRAFENRKVPGLGDVPYPLGSDVQTEVDYVRLLNHDHPVAEIATIPAEIYPELLNGGISRYAGADYPDAPFEPAIRSHFHTRFQFVFGVTNDELGYLIPKAEWDNQPPWLQNRDRPWYGEINSLGPDAAEAVLSTLIKTVRRR
jgi:hypothetical protein